MRLAEGVTADDQRCGLHIVHGHPAERLANIGCGREVVRDTFRAFGIHVDETHGGCTQWLLELALTVLVAQVGAQPHRLGTPVDLVGLPLVRTPEGEALGRQAHVLERDVPREDQEIGPRQSLAVLLLHGPQQSSCLVQAHVVGPAVQRGETLHSGSGSAAAVLDAVGARCVPRHPDEEGAVVTEVGGPPRLRVLHDVFEVTDECVDIEVGERGVVVEVGFAGTNDLRIVGEHTQIQLVRPPLLIAAAFDRWADVHRTT